MTTIEPNEVTKSSVIKRAFAFMYKYQPFQFLVTKYTPVRFWLSCPLSLVLSVAIMSAMPHYLPHNDSHLYHIAMPIIGFPIIWCVCFFYPLLEANLKRATTVMFCLFFLNFGIIILANLLL